MLKKIKNLIIVSTGSIMLLLPVGMGFASAASCSAIDQNINTGVQATLGSSTGTTNGGCTPIDGGGNSLGQIARTVVNLFSLLVGIVSVIMIIYGGFRYITSGGESGAVGNAKNTIIYAIIGLVIVALAQVIVHFVLNAALSNSVSTT